MSAASVPASSAAPAPTYTPPLLDAGPPTTTTAATAPWTLYSVDDWLCEFLHLEKAPTYPEFRGVIRRLSESNRTLVGDLRRVLTDWHACTGATTREGGHLTSHSYEVENGKQYMTIPPARMKSSEIRDIVQDIRVHSSRVTLPCRDSAAHTRRTNCTCMMMMMSRQRRRRRRGGWWTMSIQPMPLPCRSDTEKEKRAVVSWKHYRTFFVMACAMAAVGGRSCVDHPAHLLPPEHAIDGDTVLHRCKNCTLFAAPLQFTASTAHFQTPWAPPSAYESWVWTAPRSTPHNAVRSDRPPGRPSSSRSPN